MSRRHTLVCVLAGALSLVVTLVLGVRLVPDVGLYTDSGIALYPSPLGTLVGSLGGVYGLALVQAVACASLAGGLYVYRPSLAALAIAGPVLWWFFPLGVDAIAAVLLARALVLRPDAGPWLAAGFHLAALPIAVALWSRRSPLFASLACGVGFVCLLLTPYGSALPGSLRSIVQGLPAAAVVLGLASAPLALFGLPARARGELVAVALGTACVVLYATTAHVESGEGFGLSVFAASRYGLPLALCGLLAGGVHMGERSGLRQLRGRSDMRLKVFGLMLAVAALGALVLSGSALAVTVPAIPVSAYGDSLLSSLATAIGTIFPYAAAITAFAIGVGMVKRWLGHRKATRV